MAILRRTRTTQRLSSCRRRVAVQFERLEERLALAESGQIVSATPSSFVGGQSTQVTVRVQNTGDADDMIIECDSKPSGWSVSPTFTNPFMASGSFRNETFTVTPPTSGGNGTIVWKFYDDDVLSNDLLATLNQSVSATAVANPPGTPTLGLWTPDDTGRFMDDRITSIQNPRIRFQASGNVSRFRYDIDRVPDNSSPTTPASSGFAEIRINLPANQQSTIIAFAEDAVGNRSQSGNVAVRHLSAPSPPRLSSPANNSTVSVTSPRLIWDDIAFSWKFEVELRNTVTGQINTSGEDVFTSWSAPNLADGSYAWKVRARDVANNLGQYSAESRFTVSTNEPPVVDAKPDTVTVVEGEPVSLTGTFTDEDGPFPLDLRWSVVASNGEPIPGKTGPEFSFVPTDPGIYTVTFTATDGAGGSGKDEVKVTVGNLPPVLAPIPSLAAVDEGQLVAIHATATDPAGSLVPVMFNYDFGGGFQPNSQHIFPDNKTYAIRVRASDGAGGEDIETTQVEVRNVAPTVALPSDKTQLFGAPITLVARRGQNFTVPGTTFIDPGTADTHTFLWHVTSNNGQTVPDSTDAELSVLPTAAGKYTIELTVKDDDGGMHSDVTVVDVDYDLSPLQLEGTFTPRNGRMEATGEVLIGRKSEPFVPQVKVVNGTFSYDQTGITAKGVTFTSLVGGETAPLFVGDFGIPRGQTAAAITETGVAPGEFRPAGLGMKVSLIDFLGGALWVEGDITLPNSLGGGELSIRNENGFVFGQAGVRLEQDLVWPSVPILIRDSFEVNLTTFSSMSAQYVHSPQQLDYLKLQGKVSVPAVYGFTADLSGDNFIRIANGQVDLKGKLELSDFSFGGDRWAFSDPYLDFDTTTGVLKGGAKFKLPKVASLEAGLGLEIVNGRYRLDEATLGVGNLKIPIGTTGAFLQSVRGTVGNLAQAEPFRFANLTLEGAIGLSAGPPLPITVPLPNWLGGDIEKNTPLIGLDLTGQWTNEYLRGTGSINILGRITAATATAELNWERGILHGKGKFGNPFGFFDAEASFQVDTNYNVTLRGSQAIKLPTIPFTPLQGQQIAGGTSYFQYRNNTVDTDDYFVAYGTVNFGGLFNQTLGVKADFTGDVDVLLSMDEIAPLVVPVPIDESEERAFRIDADMDEVLLFAAWQNDAPNADVEIVHDDGKNIHIYRRHQLAPNMRVADVVTDARRVGIAMSNPLPGTWTLRLPDTTNLGTVELQAYHDSSGPQIEIQSAQVVDNGTAVQVSYVAVDEDSEARISFFVDSDNAGADGILLGERSGRMEGPDSSKLNVKAIPPGFSYIYAVIDDGRHAPVIDYGPRIQFASIEGTVWNDRDRNGGLSSTEPAIDKSVVFADHNRDGVLDSNDTKVTTDANGRYQLPIYTTGPVQVAQVPETGWAPTYPGRIGDTTQLNATTAAQTQATPLVAWDANGDYVVVWDQFKNGEWDVFARAYSSDGRPQTGDIPVNVTTRGRQTACGVAIAPDYFVVVWQSTHDSDGGVYARKIGRRGEDLGNEGIVGPTNQVSKPATIAMSPSGRFVIAWIQATDLNESNIFVQRFASDGRFDEAPFQVNKGLPLRDAQAVSASMDDNGRFVIVWTTGGPGPNRAFARIYAANGQEIGGEIPIVEGSQGDLDVAMDREGNFVVTWILQGGDGIPNQLFAQRFLSNGSRSGDEIRVDQQPTWNHLAPHIGMARDGHFTIGWLTQPTSTSTELYNRVFWPDGEPVGDAFYVSAGVAQGSTSHDVAMDGVGNMVVAWTPRRQNDIFVQRYTALGDQPFHFVQLSPGEVRTGVDFGLHTPGRLVVDGSLTLRASSDRLKLEVYEGNPPPAGSAPIFTWPMDATETLQIKTLDGDDVIFDDLPSGSRGPAGGIKLDAGSGVNSLIVRRSLLVDATATGGSMSTLVLGNGELRTSRLNQESLWLVGGSPSAIVLPGGETSVIGSLTLSTGATLDITDNALIVDYTGTSAVDTVRQQVVAGRGGAGIGSGTWSGTGITSSTAAAANAVDQEAWSVGYADNVALPLGAYANFGGVAVDDTSVLIKFTRTGDANLDGIVDDDDVTIIGATYAPGVPNANWAMGDFDYNGFVDDDDVTLLGAFYERTGALTLPSPRHGESQATGGRGVADAGAALTLPSPEGRGVLNKATFGLMDLRGPAAGGQARTRAQQANALTLPSPDLPSAGARRGASGVFAAPESRDVGGLTPAFTGGRGINHAAREAGALTLPSPEGRGVSGNRDDEILVDLLAESVVAVAAGRGANLGETGLPLRRAVSDVMALWPG